MKKKLLGYNIYGPKELDGLKVSFLAKDRKTEVDKESNLSLVFDNEEGIYVNNLNFIYGYNASGKTNFLKSTFQINEFSNYNRSKRKFKFYVNKDKEIRTIAYFSIGNYLFKHILCFFYDKFNKLNVKIEEIYYYDMNKNKKIRTSELENIILNKKNVESKSKIRFNEIFKYDKNNISSKFEEKEISFFKEVSNFLLENHKNEFENKNELIEKVFLNQIELIEDNKISKNNLIEKIFDNEDLKKDAISFVNVFDKEIKNISLDSSYFAKISIYKIEFQNGKKILTHSLNEILSSGTIRGMILLSIIKSAIKKGEDIYIDEIEVNLNKKIVSFILNLFIDREINKNGSRLFTSTHFPENLNKTSRRDSIYLTEWKNQKQKIVRLNEIKEEKIKETLPKREIKNTKIIEKILEININPDIKEKYEFKEKFK